MCKGFPKRVKTGNTPPPSPPDPSSPLEGGFWRGYLGTSPDERLAACRQKKQFYCIVISQVISLYVSYDIAVSFHHLEQAVPSPSDGWHACSRRCQLALDLTVRGTSHLYPPPALSGRLQRGWFLFLFRFRICCFTWNYISSKIATFSLSCSWQKGDRPDNEPLSHAASRQKKHCYLTELLLY